MAKPYPFMMPSDTHFSDVMKERSIKHSTRVILYDTKAGQPYYATRTYFMIRAMGHKNVSVLNGGMVKWLAEGRPVEKEENGGTEEDYKYTLDESLMTHFEQIEELEKDIGSGAEKNVEIIDTRIETDFEEGHIEHAKNIFWKKIINLDNTIKTHEDFIKSLTEHNVDPSKKIVNTCNSGMTATMSFAACLASGLTNTTVNDGSWQEYIVRKKK